MSQLADDLSFGLNFFIVVIYIKIEGLPLWPQRRKTKIEVAYILVALALIVFLVYQSAAMQKLGRVIDREQKRQN